MRDLTAKQKKYLAELARQGVKNVDSMTSAQWEKLKDMNETEILWQNANAFLWDYRFNFSDVKEPWFK